MKGYGIKRIGGRGYENKNVIRRRRKGRDRAFYFFLLLFGVSVYLIATALFRFSALPAFLPWALLSL